MHHKNPCSFFVHQKQCITLAVICDIQEWSYRGPSLNDQFALQGHREVVFPREKMASGAEDGKSLPEESLISHNSEFHFPQVVLDSPVNTFVKGFQCVLKHIFELYGIFSP